MAIGAWLLLTFVVVIARLVVDEDVNHWNWTRDGASRAINIWIVGSSAVVAAVVVAGAAWLFATVT